MRLHKVLRTLILSDLFIIGSFGLIQPIFAIFVIQGIPDASITSVGIALTIQLFTKAAFQIIVGKWDDADTGNKRELYTLLLGSLIISLVPLGYAFATSVLTLYASQFLFGLGNALIYPSWRIIFSHYMDKDKEGYEWSIYDTVISLATAAAAAVGAFIAQQFSFRMLFIFVSVMSFVGTFFIVSIFRQEFTRPSRKHTHRAVARHHAHSK